MIKSSLISFSLILVSALIPPSHTQGTSSSCTVQGTPVNVGGYVMDNLCINRGTLLDNPSVKTLLNPEQHTIHCLIDIQRCIDSGFTILEKLPTAQATADVQYKVKYQLGNEGTQVLITLLDEARKGGMQAGYLANLTGVDDGSGTLKCVQPFGRSLVVSGGANKTSSATSSIGTGP
ncbi:hypothetical protein HDV05_000853, partial [Chytridiales sp. JEL 0842]